MDLLGQCVWLPLVLTALQNCSLGIVYQFILSTCTCDWVCFPMYALLNMLSYSPISKNNYCMKGSNIVYAYVFKCFFCFLWPVCSYHLSIFSNRLLLFSLLIVGTPYVWRKLSFMQSLTIFPSVLFIFWICSWHFFFFLPCRKFLVLCHKTYR